MDLGETFFGDNPVGKYQNQPFTALISDILPNIFVLAGLVLLIYALFGGYLMITSGSDSHSFEQGQGVITNAIIGFVIIFASYWIIQIIQILTGVKIL